MDTPYALDPELMKALVRNSPWQDLLKNCLLPRFERSEEHVLSGDNPFSRGYCMALRDIIQQAYAVAGVPNPLDRRYQFDEDLTNVSSRRPYKKRVKKEEELEQIQMPPRSSYAV